MLSMQDLSDMLQQNAHLHDVAGNVVLYNDHLCLHCVYVVVDMKHPRVYARLGRV
jgi:uncharacterized Zn-finger protein